MGSRSEPDESIRFDRKDCFDLRRDVRGFHHISDDRSSVGARAEDRRNGRLGNAADRDNRKLHCRAHLRQSFEPAPFLRILQPPGYIGPKPM